MEMAVTDKSKKRKVVISTALGAVAGFLVSFGLMELIDSGRMGDLDGSRSAAALVGALYLLTGTFVGIGLLNPDLGAKYLNVEDADELREQMSMLRYSTFGIAAWGVVMLLLAFAAPAGPVPQVAVAIAVVILFALSWVATRKQFAVADELMKSLSRESTSMTFYLMFVIGGGWAMLAHLEYVPAPQSLDWVTMFAGAILVGTFWVCGKRGLLSPR